jgi:hypothetical protein
MYFLVMICATTQHCRVWLSHLYDVQQAQQPYLRKQHNATNEEPTNEFTDMLRDELGVLNPVSS